MRVDSFNDVKLDYTTTSCLPKNTSCHIRRPGCIPHGWEWTGQKKVDYISASLLSFSGFTPVNKCIEQNRQGAYRKRLPMPYMPRKGKTCYPWALTATPQPMLLPLNGHRHGLHGLQFITDHLAKNICWENFPILPLIFCKISGHGRSL